MTIRRLRIVFAVAVLGTGFISALGASSGGAAVPARHIGPASYVPLRGGGGPSPADRVFPTSTTTVAR